MAKEIINTDKAPKAIGPYSQAVKMDNWLFLSGQIPINPATGEITGDIKVQTQQVLENIKSIVSASGASFADVVKTAVFLKDLNDFTAMNEVYQQYFIIGPPARSTLQVARIPRDALVEIEAIVFVNEH